jgi:peptidylprolyl isomerase
MNKTFPILLMAAATVVASAQTTATPAPAAKPAAKAAATATTAKTAGSAVPAAGAKKPLPLGVPAPGLPAVKTIKKTAFSLTYQEIKVGTGPIAEPGKMYTVLYTGYRAADGVKFDSSDDHRMPVRDKDGKPVLGDDGKPKMGDAQPLVFPQGQRRLIPGFDQGFGGMKVGGQRRLFIPWQMAYGTQAIPDHLPDHPGIPAKSDLIFDITLVSVADMPAPPSRPAMGGMPGGHPVPMGIHPGTPGAPGAPAAAGTPAAPNAPAAPAAATSPAAPPAPAKPATTAPVATAPTPTAPAATATPAAPAQPQSK